MAHELRPGAVAADDLLAPDGLDYEGMLNEILATRAVRQKAKSCGCAS